MQPEPTLFRYLDFLSEVVCVILQLLELKLGSRRILAKSATHRTCTSIPRLFLMLPILPISDLNLEFWSPNLGCYMSLHSKFFIRGKQIIKMYARFLSRYPCTDAVICRATDNLQILIYFNLNDLYHLAHVRQTHDS